MKNIQVLPTNKPSRLYFWEDKLVFGRLATTPMNRNIYITSDEEIRDVRPHKGKWHLEGGNILNKFPNYLTDLTECKLVIMTTDQDLIKNGVQPIDDEFLEWFVKNPSCESVHVYNQTQVGYEYDEYHFILEEPFIEYTNTNDCTSMIYNPKEETLEEAAKSKYGIGYGAVDSINAFIEGTKWQAERMYSELELFINEVKDKIDSFEYSVNQQSYISEYMTEWFEQFKKK